MRKILSISLILLLLLSLLPLSAFALVGNPNDIDNYIENWPTGTSEEFWPTGTVTIINEATGNTITYDDFDSLGLQFSVPYARGSLSVQFTGVRHTNVSGEQPFYYTIKASDLGADYIRGFVMEYNDTLYECPVPLIGNTPVNLWSTASFNGLYWPMPDGENIKIYIITTNSRYVFGSYKLPEVTERKFSLLAQPLQYDSSFSFNIFSTFNDVLFGYGPFTYGEARDRFATNVGPLSSFSANLTVYEPQKPNVWYRFLIRTAIYGEKDFPESQVIEKGVPELTVKIKDDAGQWTSFRMGELPFELKTDVIWDENNQCYYFDYNVSVLLDSAVIGEDITLINELNVMVSHNKVLSFDTDEILYFELLNAYQGVFTPEAKEQLEFYDEERKYEVWHEEQENKNNEAKDVIDQMGQLEKPDVGTVVPDVDDIVSKDEVHGFTNSLNVVFDGSPFFESLLILSLTISLTAFILFGKQK